MAILFCPSCRGKVRVTQDVAGKRIRCPLCEMPFQIPATKPAAAVVIGGEDDFLESGRDEDTPRFEDLTQEERLEVLSQANDELTRSRYGLIVLGIANWLQVAGLIFLLLVVLMNWGGIYEGLELLVILAGLFGIGGHIFTGIGQGFLIAGPNRQNSRPYAITATTTWLFALMIGVGIVAANPTGVRFVGIEERVNVTWAAVVTFIPVIPVGVFSAAAPSGDDAIGLATPVMKFGLTLAAFVEILQLVFLALHLRALGRITRGPGTPKACVAYIVWTVMMVVTLSVIGLVFAIIMKNANPATLTSLMFSYLTLVYGGLTAAKIHATRLCQRVRDDVEFRDTAML